MPLNKCSICHGTGLIPFKNKEGKVIPFAFLDCSCREPMRDHYTALTPSDFDFPVSDTFRGFYHERYSGNDPAYSPPRPDTTAIEDRLSELEDITSLPGAVPHKYEYQLGQIKWQMLHLEKRVIEMRAEKAKRAEELKAKKQRRYEKYQDA